MPTINQEIRSISTFRTPHIGYAGWLFVLLVHADYALASDAAIDASDPTRIYTFLGAGPKYSRYTNNEYMVEVRTTGNWGIDDNDMLLFEFGYGWHDGNLTPGSDTGITNPRIRYFHLLSMDYELDHGYRGMGLQADLQFAGELKGTDGQNVMTAGIMPTFAFDPEWNLYLMLGAVGSWDKSFAKFNGAGVNLSPKFVYSPETLWEGAQFQLTPTVKYFVSGTLENKVSGNLEFNIGGEFTPTLMWDIVGDINLDVDLKSFRGESDAELENDWSIFFNVTSFF